MTVNPSYIQTHTKKLVYLLVLSKMYTVLKTHKVFNYLRNTCIIENYNIVDVYTSLRKPTVARKLNIMYFKMRSKYPKDTTLLAHSLSI